MSKVSVSSVSRIVAKIAFLWALWATHDIVGQGEIEFRTRAGGELNLQFTYADGTLLDNGFTAQLYGGPVDNAIASLEPLLPTVGFRSGYVLGPVVRVPGVNPGQQATFIMRAFNGAAWETSICRGESNPFTIQLGGAGLPPPLPHGLEPFSVSCIPEPPPLALWSSLWLVMLWIAAKRCIGNPLPDADTQRV